MAHLSDFVEHAVQELQLVLTLLLVGLVDDLLSEETKPSPRCTKHKAITEGTPHGHNTLHSLCTYVSFRSFQQFNSGLLGLLQIGLQSFHLRKDEFVFYSFG